MENEKKSKIDEYKSKLYSRKYKNTNEDDLEKLTKLKQKDYELEDNWDDVELELERNTDLYKYEKNEINWYTIFLVISFVFFIVAASFTGFFLYFQKNEIALNTAVVKLVAPDKVDSGKVLDYEIRVENNTERAFKNISLYIKYPDGTVTTDGGGIIEKEETDLKNILPGGIEKVKKSIIFSGAPDEEKKVSFVVNYQIDGYSTPLLKKKEFSVKIGSAPIFVKIDTPKYVTSGKEFDINLEISSNSSFPLKDILLIGRYPNNFELTANDPDPITVTNHKNIFKIKELKIGEKKEIHIKGKVRGENGEMKIISFVAGSGELNDTQEIKLKYFESQEKILVKKPGLDLQLICNGDDIDDAVSIVSGELDCNYILTNNLQDKITDVKVKMDYDDSIINEWKLEVPDGYTETNENYLYWDKNTSEDFVVINSHQSIKMPFVFVIKPARELAGNILNPEVPLKFNIKGVNYDNENKLGVVDRVVEKKLKLNTRLDLKSSVSYEKGVLENIGGPTPQVGREISYTVNLKLYNTTNKLKNLKLIGKLPVGIEWKNQYSPENYYVSYEPSSRIVKWSLKTLPAYIGYRTEPRTLSLKLAFTPILADVGELKLLMKDIIVQGQDEFTGETISYKMEKILNDLSSDGEFSISTGRVIK